MLGLVFPDGLVLACRVLSYQVRMCRGWVVPRFQARMLPHCCPPSLAWVMMQMHMVVVANSSGAWQPMLVCFVIIIIG